uniref:Uncharacterized protein n=1 Tax=Gadus morhua TaxID=8049 RepID=A0A8C5ACC8_GADMO
MFLLCPPPLSSSTPQGKEPSTRPSPDTSKPSRLPSQKEGNKENRSEADVSEVQGEVKRRSVFEKAVYDLKHCERVMDEVTFGRRVSLYELRGEIGSGNFSQVRLGIHDLTNGEKTLPGDGVCRRRRAFLPHLRQWAPVRP